MKKLMITAVLSGVFASSVLAGTGTIKSVWVKSDRTIIRLDNNEACRVDNTQDAEFVKQMVAAALTAKAQGSTVTLNYNGAQCTDLLVK